MHHQKITQVPDKDVWIETYTRAEDIGFWTATRTTIGTEVRIWKRQPSPRSEPSEAQKWFCRILFFFCALAAWIAERARDPDRWPASNDLKVDIIIRNTYYDAAAREVGNKQKHCAGFNESELSLERFSFGLSGYPDFNGSLVYGVCSTAVIHIYGQQFEHSTWESDGHALPCPDAPTT